jgi:GNAT superfamily N-acetyltransferase
VTDHPVKLRPAKPQDGDFLADMLVEAVNWSPEWKKRSRSRVLSYAATARYITGWPRQTDLGVIAETDAGPAGAAWLRFFPAAEPGYGFVAPEIPELTIGVARPWRGQGIGRVLLGAIASQASAAGLQKISLSVERKNFAQKLYLSEGYQIVDSGSDSDTMVKEVGPKVSRGPDFEVRARGTRSPQAGGAPVLTPGALPAAMGPPKPGAPGRPRSPR